MNLDLILSRLEASRLIVIAADKCELGHDSLAELIAKKRGAEEKALIEWTLLIRNKLNAGKQSGAADYLTMEQLIAVQSFEIKLALNEEESRFLAESKAFYQAQEKKKTRKKRILFLAMTGVLVIITMLMFTSMYLKHQADLELSRNNAILNNMHFFADRYALTLKKGQSGHFIYGFMDKQGNAIIKYDYSEANPFDDYGYARVKTEEKLFLIDTFNNRFPLAESPKTITEKTLALSLKEQLLDELPARILKNTDLKVLYLRGNRLKSLPDGFEKFEKLEVLDLGYNQFEKIPESVFQLKKLDQLDLQSNKIDSIRVPEIHSKSLKIINLSRNNLPQLQTQITNLSNLVLLDLSNNELKEINEKVADLKNLKTLNLFGNLIKTVPERLLNSEIDIIVEDKIIPKSQDRKSESNKKSTLRDKDEIVLKKETAIESSVLDRQEQLNCSSINNSKNKNNPNSIFETQKLTLAKIDNKTYYIKIIVLKTGIWAQISKDETAQSFKKGKGILVFRVENQGQKKYLKFNYTDDENSVIGSSGLMKIAKMEEDDIKTIIAGSSISVNIFNINAGDNNPIIPEGNYTQVKDADDFKNILSCILSEINTQNIIFNTQEPVENAGQINQPTKMYDEATYNYLNSVNCNDSKSILDLSTEKEFRLGLVYDSKQDLVKMTLMNSGYTLANNSKIIFFNNDREEKSFGVSKLKTIMTGASITDVTEISMEKKELNWFLKKEIAGFFMYNPTDDLKTPIIFNKKVNLRRHIACFTKSLNLLN